MDFIFVSEYIFWFYFECLSNTMYTIFGVYIFFLSIIASAILSDVINMGSYSL